MVSISAHTLAFASLTVSLVLAGCGNAAKEEAPTTRAPTTQPTPTAPPAPTTTPTPKVDIAGKWVSQCLGPQNGSFAQLTFDIDAATWKLDYEVFGDAACTAALATVHIEGPYEINAASTIVTGAHEGVFSFTKRSITAHAQPFADFLASASGCGRSGFTVGVATDIHEAGCAGIGAYPHSACPADYDIVERIGDELRFGQRPADNNMCTADKRPTARAPFALKHKG